MEVIGQTGIPHEQEIPAPVTTTIFLDFATDSEMSERARLVEESVARESKLRVTVMVGWWKHCPIWDEQWFN